MRCNICNLPVGSDDHHQNAMVSHVACAIESAYAAHGRTLPTESPYVDTYREACEKRAEQVKIEE